MDLDGPPAAAAPTSPFCTDAEGPAATLSDWIPRTESIACNLSDGIRPSSVSTQLLHLPTRRGEWASPVELTVWTQATPQSAMQELEPGQEVRWAWTRRDALQCRGRCVLPRFTGGTPLTRIPCTAGVLFGGGGTRPPVPVVASVGPTGQPCLQLYTSHGEASLPLVGAHGASWDRINAIAGLPPSGGVVCLGADTSGQLCAAHTPHHNVTPVWLSHGLPSPVADSACVSAAASDRGYVIAIAATEACTGTVHVSLMHASRAAVQDPVRPECFGMGDVMEVTAGQPKQLIHWPQFDLVNVFVLITDAGHSGCRAIVIDGEAADDCTLPPSQPFCLTEGRSLVGAALVGSQLAVVHADYCELWAAPDRPLQRVRLPGRVVGLPLRFDAHSFAAPVLQPGTEGDEAKLRRIEVCADPTSPLVHAALGLLSTCLLASYPPLHAYVLRAQPAQHWHALEHALVAAAARGPRHADADPDAAPPAAAVTPLQRMRLETNWLLRGAEAAPFAARRAAHAPPPHSAGELSPPPAALGRGEAAAALCVLHVLHESARVSSVWRPHAPQLAATLRRLALRLGLGLYASHYEALYPHLGASPCATAGEPPGSDGVADTVSRVVQHAGWFCSTAAPPDVVAWARTVSIAKRIPDRPFPSVPSWLPAGAPCAAARVLCHMAELRLGSRAAHFARSALSAQDWEEMGERCLITSGTLASSTDGRPLLSRPVNPLAGDGRVVSGILQACRDRAPGAVRAARSLGVLPAAWLTHSTLRCRDDPPTAAEGCRALMQPRMLDAIGRTDLALLSRDIGRRRQPPVEGVAPRGTPCCVFQPLSDVGCTGERVTQEYPERAMRERDAAEAADELGVSIGSLGSSLKLRWGGDDRVELVQSLLCSAVPVKLKGTLESIVDPVEQQQQLNQAANRVLSLPCGRGLFTLETLNAPPPTRLPIPPLVLCGRRARDNSVASLDLGNSSPDFTLWPEFLNGCAAGLRLRMRSAEESPITNRWVLATLSPSRATPAAGGLALGLGLLGHLRVLSKAELFRLINARHDLTTIGILLGACAAWRGSPNQTVSKMLALFLAPLTPVYSDNEVTLPLQAAAVLGAGLLHQGTKDSFIAEILLGELSRAPSDEHCANLHAYALTAGFALGLTCLAKRSSASVEDRLGAMLAGDRRRAEVGSSSAWQPAVDELDEPVGSGVPGAMRDARARESTANKVINGPGVATYIAAPGAAIALGLMYFGSKDGVAAGRLRLPRTAPLLDGVNPDSALARSVALGLVQWDDIEATQEWLDTLVTPVMTRAVRRALRKAHGSAAAAAGHRAAAAPSPEEGSSSGDDETHAMRLAGGDQHLLLLHAHATAGGLFALGLRNAGTEAEGPSNLILKHLRGFAQGQCGAHAVSMFPSATAGASKRAADPCVCAAVMALAMVMAGSGNVTIVRELRQLQRRTDSSYGVHMAISMGLGMLFLGGGSRSLTATPEAAAALLVSCYPRFPSSPSDSSFHWQFMRPLVALAAVPRLLETRDAVNGVSVSLPVRITAARPKGTEPLCGDRPDFFTSFTPCLVPQAGHFGTVVVSASDYYQLRLSAADPRHVKALRDGVLYVRRRATARGPADLVAAGAALDVEQAEGAAPPADSPPPHAQALISTALVACGGGPWAVHAAHDLRAALTMLPAEHCPGGGDSCAGLVAKLRRQMDAYTRRLLAPAVAALLGGKALGWAEAAAVAWHGVPAPGALQRALRAAASPQGGGVSAPQLAQQAQCMSPAAVAAVCAHSAASPGGAHGGG